MYVQITTTFLRFNNQRTLLSNLHVHDARNWL